MRWARLKIEREGKGRSFVLNILAGGRSYEVPISLEIILWVVRIFLVEESFRNEVAEQKVVEECNPRTKRSVVEG